MKNKIKIDLMSPSISLNDLVHSQYNGILSYEVPSKWIHNNTLPESLKIYNDTNLYNMIFTIENIIDNNNKTCIQKIYNVEDDKVFYRLGYPAGYNIDLTVNPNVNYTFTNWKNDSFDESIMDNYYSKFDLNNLFLKDDTTNKAIFKDIFSYKGNRKSGSYLDITDTGYYVITGALQHAPSYIQGHDIDGILEVYNVSDKIYQVLTVSANRTTTAPIEDANLTKIKSLFYNNSEPFTTNETYNHAISFHFRSISKYTGANDWVTAESIHKIYAYKYWYDSLEKFVQENAITDVYSAYTTTSNRYYDYNTTLNANQDIPYSASMYASPNFNNTATTFTNIPGNAITFYRKLLRFKRNGQAIDIARWG